MISKMSDPPSIFGGYQNRDEEYKQIAYSNIHNTYYLKPLIRVLCTSGQRSSTDSPIVPLHVSLNLPPPIYLAGQAVSHVPGPSFVDVRIAHL